MGDFTSIRQHVYSAGAIIVAANHNDNENEIYQEHNNAFNASTGHGHTGATGDGPKLTSAGLDLTATYAWSGVHTHTANLNLHSGADLNMYSDAGTTLKFTVDGATGSFGIPSGQKFYVDGTALTGNTYIYQSSAGRMDLHAGGALNIQLTPTITAFGLDVQLTATKKLYFDSGVDTFAYEKSANLFVVATAGVDGLGVSGGDGIGIVSGKKLFLDGIGMTGNTYLTESSADTISFFRGGTEQFKMSSGVNNFLAGNVYIAATNALYLDGGSNTYIYESSADVMRLVVGGTARLTATTTQVLTDSTVDLAISATKSLYFDGGGDTRIYEVSANTLNINTGGSVALQLTSGQDAILGGNLLSFDGVTSGVSVGSLLGNLVLYRGGSLVMNVTSTPVVQFGGAIMTSLGSSEAWTLGGYTAGAPAADGYLAVTVNGTTYQILCNQV